MPFRLTAPVVPESDIQSSIITHALRHPAVRWVVRVNSGCFRAGARLHWFYRLFRPGAPPATKGFPDLVIGVAEGRCLLVEVKRAGGRLRPEQKLFVEYLLGASLPVCIAHGWAEVQSCLEGMVHES